MNVETLKLKLRGIFGQQIKFNKDFDRYAASIKNIDSNLIDWCNLIKQGKIKYAPSRKINGVVFIKKNRFFK